MDLKNIIAAIALSAAVIVLYGLFFAPTQEQLDNLNTTNTKSDIAQDEDVPNIDQPIEVKTVTRDDAINSSERILFENEFIKGSISLTGGIIDDLELKTYNSTLGSEKKIQLLNPSSTFEGYNFTTGWATKSKIEIPNSNTVWKVEGNNFLAPNNPIKIYYENSDKIRFEKTISIDNKYLFEIKQNLINKSNETFKFYPYAIINRNNLPADLTDFYILHEGYTLISGENLEEVDYDDVLENKYSTEGNTGVLIQGDKYWMTSIIPEQGRKFRFDLDYNNKYRASYLDLKGYEARPNTLIEHSVKSLIGAKGKSIIEETIFSNRFMCCHELERMGAVIKINKNKEIIYGQKELSAANCISSDLRTTFSIILGAISARGVSEIQRVYHGLRGYYNIVEKLKSLGVKIRSQK